MSSLPKRPAEAPGEKSALDAAGKWLNAANLRDARAFALGEERTFEVNQDVGRLELIHADGGQVVLDIQILGSFRPQDRSLRWAWANSGVHESLTRAVCAARDHETTKAFPSLSTPTFEASFEDCARLVALAAKLGGCDGVYRCITENALTVYAGYQAPPSAASSLDPEREAQARALLDAYDAEMLPLDEEHRLKRKDSDYSAISRRLLDAKMEIYRRYWRRDDQYWEPCSFGWPSEHAPSQQELRFVVPRRAGGLYVITRGSHSRRSAHVVEFFKDGPRITDQDIDWGAGLLSPPQD